MVCFMLLTTTAVTFAENFKLNNEKPVNVNDTYQYRKSFAQAAGMKRSNSKSYYVPENLFTAGAGYWFFDGLETYGLQMTNLTYNGWASEINVRFNFSDYTVGVCDFAFLGYSMGLTEFNNGAFYFALVGGPSLRFQDEYNLEDDENKMKVYIDAYISASLNIQFSERFLLKGGYYFWAPQFKFSKDYRADGFYVSLGYEF